MLGWPVMRLKRAPELCPQRQINILLNGALGHHILSWQEQVLHFDLCQKAENWYWGGQAMWVGYRGLCDLSWPDEIAKKGWNKLVRLKGQKGGGKPELFTFSMTVGTKTGQNVGFVCSATCSCSKELGHPRLSLVSFSSLKLTGQDFSALKAKTTANTAFVLWPSRKIPRNIIDHPFREI